MRIARDCPEIPVRLLFSDPLQKWLKLRRFAERFERGVHPRQVVVRECRVDLLVTRLAQRHAVIGLAALLFREQVMKGDQMLGDGASTEGAGT